MAHACDYQSRIEKPIDPKWRVKSQVKWFIEDHWAKWTPSAIKEYCLMAYRGMGADEALVDSLIKDKRNENSCSSNGEGIH